MAPAGYGKHSAPEQPPLRADTFAHLPAREASLAMYIERLPEGAAMGIKDLAGTTVYGQMAVSTSLKYLEDAGHLRRKRRTVGENRPQWVWLTYWSRVPRSDAWWDALLGGDTPAAPPDEPPPHEPTPAVPEAHAPVPAEPEPHPTPTPPPPSRAYAVLAQLGRADHRMTLSAADCAELAPLAEEWFRRDVTGPQLITVLTSGLPDLVHSAVDFARRRLIRKLPPAPARTPETLAQPTAPTPRRMAECRRPQCRRPGPPEAFRDGLCRECRGDTTRPHESGTTATDEHVRACIADLRTTIRSHRGALRPAFT
ncbi:hypothetical protein ACFP1Z_09055 [Streptomyces gamaensis]|uniref:MarR family transcriptional regulator n=1 Tax=Streptomyces gamaensis TaxID=1763542 RepID=A0ABW0Z031_9ACTN